MIARFKRALFVALLLSILAALMLPLLVAFLALFVSAALVIAAGFVFFKVRGVE